MRYGIDIVPFGPLAEPAAVMRLARAAEAAGWELVLLWDHLAFAWGVPAAEPWTTLAAVAAVTERIRLGTGVTPLPRHRPHMLAHALATLDRLSGGRVVLGAGAGGVEAEFTAFGEEASLRIRAAQLDEALTVIDRLWAGGRVDHAGEFYRVDGVALEALPVQRPRIPIWVGGTSRPALHRAARWDGWIVGNVLEQGGMERPPAEIGHLAAGVRHARAEARLPLDGFEVAMTGYSDPGGCELPADYAAAGVTWWIESLHSLRGDEAALLERIAAGPPSAG